MSIQSGQMGSGGASNLLAMISAYKSFGSAPSDPGSSLSTSEGAQSGPSLGVDTSLSKYTAAANPYGDAIGRRQSEITTGMQKGGFSLGLNIGGGNAAKPVGKNSKIGSGNRQSGFGTLMQGIGTIAALA